MTTPDLSNLKLTDLLDPTPPNPDPAPPDPKDPSKPDPDPDPVDPPDPDPDPDPNPDPDPDPDPDPKNPKKPDNPDPEPTLIQDLAKQIGYEFGEKEEYSDDVEGLTSFVQKVAEQMSADTFQELFQAYPDVQQYMMYRTQGGDPNEYFKTMATPVDYSKLTVSEDNVPQSRMIVKAQLLNQGFSSDEADEQVTLYEEANQLTKMATKFLPKLQQATTQSQAALLKKQQDEDKAAKQKAADDWKKISDTIDTGEFHGIKISEKDKKDFYDWMAKPVDKNGNTARNKALSELDVEGVLAMEYMLFKGLDLSKVVQNARTTDKTKSLRERIGKQASVTNRMHSDSTPKLSADVPDFFNVRSQKK